jgi:hypothetical protein
MFLTEHTDFSMPLSLLGGLCEIYLTHTRLDGRFCLRLSIGQTQTRRDHVEKAWEIIQNARVVRSWR